MNLSIPIIVLLAAAATTDQCQPKPPDETTVKGISRITEQRTKAVTLALRVKTSLKPKSLQYVTARNLYDEAKAKNASYAAVLSQALYNNWNLTTSQSHKEGADDAVKATNAFLEHAGKNLDSSSTLKIKSLNTSNPSETGDMEKLTAVAVESVIKGGIEWWKAQKQLAAEQREKAAKNIKEELKWQEWDNLK